MELYNLVKTEFDKNGKMENQKIIFTTTDYKKATLSLSSIILRGGFMSEDGNYAVIENKGKLIYYNLHKSLLHLDRIPHSEELVLLYEAYFDLLVSRLKQWGEKEVSKMGDEQYRLYIKPMNYYVSDYCLFDKSHSELIEEIVLEICGNQTIVYFVSENGNYKIDLHNSEFSHIETLVNFIDRLTKFMSNITYKN